MIELGLCAFGLNDGWGLEGSLRVARDLGFAVVDVGAGQLGGQAAVAESPEAFGRHLRAAADSHGLRVEEFFVMAIDVDGHRCLGLDTEPAVQQRAAARWRALCRCAELAGCRSIMGAIGHVDPALGPSRSFDLVTESARQWTAIAAEHGLVFTAEIDADGFFGTPAGASTFMEAVPGFGLTVDYAHWVSRGRILEDCFYLHPWARHFHVKQARPGYLKSFWHRGTIDFAQVVSDLRARSWSGVLAVETAGYHLSGHVGTPYAEVRHPYAPQPPSAGVVAHPLHQAVLHAQAIDAALAHDGAQTP